MNGLLQKISSRFKPRGQISYAQFGEDIILKTVLLDILHIARPTYMDVGAHHPYHFSNTYLLYLQGTQGTCVEPDPELCGAIKRARPRDNCMAIGIGIHDQKDADFFIFNAKTLNTFCEVEARKIEAAGEYRLEKVIKVPLVSINQLLEQTRPKFPDLISLDTEGFDVEILKSFDFSRHRPAVFCVETLTYPGEEKIVESFNILRRAGYLVLADTYINTIFVEGDLWNKKRGTKLGTFNDFRWKA